MIDPNSLNFLTKEFPIPPVAPVIKTFYFLNSFSKFLISANVFIEKLFASLIVLFTMPPNTLPGPISIKFLLLVGAL